MIKPEYGSQKLNSFYQASLAYKIDIKHASHTKGESRDLCKHIGVLEKTF